MGEHQWKRFHFLCASSRIAYLFRYIYWRLLSADPAAAKQVVLAEKPLISEETDLLEPSLLDQLVCHIGSLASVYHKPPSSFVDGARQPLRAGTGVTKCVTVE